MSSDTFDNFMKEVKEIETRDSVLTSAQQIERLVKTGSSYRNLNPYSVLLVGPDDSVEVAKKSYRRLSILVHPDKNRDDADRAQAAFDAVKKAWSMLENDETRVKCLDVVEEAKGRIAQNIEEKKKKLRKEGKKDLAVEEEQPENYKRAVETLTMKLFADMERRRQQLETRMAEETQRQRQTEQQEEERRKLVSEFNKNFEESREGRVNSWQNFKQSGSSSGKMKKEKKEKKMFKPMGFRPPKLKPEQR